MNDVKLSDERLNLLADIADMYFLKGKTQSEIAGLVRMTRSNVSRLLKEAKQSGIVEIHINRPIKEDTTLAQELVERFDLINARIVETEHSENRLNRLGRVAADELIYRLKPNMILGTSWGTGISATVDELENKTFIPGIKVVQMVGALGAHGKEYDGPAIVSRLEEKLDAEGIYFRAPFFVESEEMAQSILETRSVAETLSIASQADIALLGIGSIGLEHSSYYLAGYATKEEILTIQKSGAIGDVCAHFFDLNGKFINHPLRSQMIIASEDVVQNIPIRIGVAGGREKILPIIGALRGGLVNILITDVITAREVLGRATS